jgi:hypothetical protein
VEKIMSKTNDTSKPAALDDYGTLAGIELDAVSGGFFGGFFAHPLPAANVAVPAPNVTVNGGPLAFVAP